MRESAEHAAGSPDRRRAPADAGAAAGAERTCDVLVVGGGPAGSTAATVLARRGRRVVLLEKDVHPRFHIGESLLAQNLAIFERLGVLDEVRAIGIKKPGAEFVSDEHGGASRAFLFADGLALAHPHAYQVKRAELDEILFRNAARAGAETHEGVRVKAIELGAAGAPARVAAVGPDGGALVWEARHLIDASGRDGLLAGTVAPRTRNKNNNTAALFGHFENVLPHHAVETGNIAIHLFDGGWFWAIPLRGGITSIGAVSDAGFFKRRAGGDLEAFLWEAIRGCPSLARRTASARLASPVTATGNYSYSSSRMRGEGYTLVGDAYAFLDPVFSSGVMLAMQSAALGAEAVDLWLDDPRRAEPAFRAFERKVRGSLKGFSWLVYRINDPVLRDLFMQPSNRFRMRDGIVSILGGSPHGNRRAVLPVLAFKLCYRFFKLAHRCGYRLRDGKLARVAPAGAPAAAGGAGTAPARA